MASTSGYWGIDIGQTALKALRCQLASDGKTLEATAFDYIEYPKILSQPDAEPEKLVREALEKFLSHNKVKGDRVAISVPGQSGLARYFKPPPVDAKKLPEIVKYEAKQQIPFPLKDVVWDWQQIGGTVVEGFTLESEIGLFAMKREQVFKALKPFEAAEVEIDVIQLSPLSIYNFIAHDQLDDVPGELDLDNWQESLIVLSMGTENSDLVVTNGFKVWQRSLSLGGSHFTKQLMKELKLTFAKAEHLKRNARAAEDPKAVFQAMRSVYNDLVTEMQRSLGFYQNLEKSARLGKVVLLGNTSKLPGLAQYIGKNLGHDVIETTSFKRLTGSAVTTAPNFKENSLSFGVCYGLCLQGLGLGKLKTNLLPREIIVQRLVEEKKPWTLAGVAALLLAFAFNYFFVYNAWWGVHPERARDEITWKAAQEQVTRVDGKSKANLATDANSIETLAIRKVLGEEVAGNADRRVAWLELLTAIQTSLPAPVEYRLDQPPDPTVIPIYDRKEIHIEYIESEYVSDLTTWFTDTVRRRYWEGKNEIDGTVVAAPVPANPGDPSAAPAGQAPLPEGSPEKEGWVIEIGGHHFFNKNQSEGGARHVYRTLLANLENGRVELPLLKGEGRAEFTMQEIGIRFPTLVVTNSIDRDFRVRNPRFELPAALPGVDGQPIRPPTPKKEDASNPPDFPAPRYRFVVQFCWQPIPVSKRLQIRAEKEKAEAAKRAAEAAANPMANNPGANPNVAGTGS